MSFWLFLATRRNKLFATLSPKSDRHLRQDVRLNCTYEFVSVKSIIALLTADDPTFVLLKALMPRCRSVRCRCINSSCMSDSPFRMRMDCDARPLQGAATRVQRSYARTIRTCRLMRFSTLFVHASPVINWLVTRNGQPAPPSQSR